MKKPRLSFIWGMIMFILVAGIYAGGYLFYKDYTEKVAHFVSQNKYINGYIARKSSTLQNNLRKLESTLDELKTANTREQKRILTRVDTITEEIQEWKDEYTTSLDEIKENYSSSVERLQTNIEQLKNIDLGEISVKKNIKE